MVREKNWCTLCFCATSCTLLLIIPLFSALARPSQPTIVYQMGQFQNGSFIWNLYTMDIKGGNVRQLTNNPWMDIRPDWSPDGTRIVFHSGGTLALINCDGSNFQRLPTENASVPVDPDWSPDGTKIVFSDCVWAVPHDGREDIFVLDLPSGTVRNLTNHPQSDRRPSWSPDGKWIVFSSNRDPNFWLPNPGAPLGFVLTDDLYIMDTEGNLIRNLTQTQAGEAYPAWSPDGTQIAFIRFDGFKSDLYVMSIEGKQTRRLTNLKGTVMSVSWSPDSQQIIFSLNLPDKGEDVYVIDRNGANLHAITNNLGTIARSPSWFSPGLGVSPVGLKHTTWGAIKQRNK